MQCRGWIDRSRPESSLFLVLKTGVSNVYSRNSVFALTDVLNDPLDMRENHFVARPCGVGNR
jgi:hypothetical protein